MERTTTHEPAESDSKTLRILRNMPDWLIIVLIILLAFVILGVGFVL